MQKFSSKLYQTPQFIPELGMYMLRSKLHNDWVLVPECKYLRFDAETGHVESEYFENHSGLESHAFMTFKNWFEE